jgi:iron(III) transport system permease protein
VTTIQPSTSSSPLSASLAFFARRTRLLLQDPSLFAAGGVLLLLAWLILYPLFWLFYGSFAYGEQGLGEIVAQLRALPGLPRALYDTAFVIAGTLPLAFAFALPLAWIAARTDTPLRGLIEITALMPFITPPLIGAIAWSLLGAPRTGFINVVARALTGTSAPVVDIYTRGGVIFVLGLYLSSYVFITVKAVMERMDASFEDASFIAGASLFHTIRRVIIPLSLPALLSAGILVFVNAIEDFAIPGILGAPGGIFTITTYIYYHAISYLPPRYGVAAVLATLIMLLTAVAFLIQARVLAGERSFTTVSGRGRRPRRLRLGRWRYVTLLYAFLYFFFTVGLPYLVLIYGAFIKTWGLMPTFANLTWANVVGTFEASPVVVRGLSNSLILALGGATVASLLTAVMGYVIVKSKARMLAGAMDFLSTIPLTMSGPVIAVALLWAYIQPPFMLYGTLWILGIAYVTRYLPYGVRTVTASLRQVSDELENAAAICGASRFAGFRDVLFPLVRPGILAGWMLMFISMMRELSASIFLFTPGTETTAVALFNLWEEGIFSYVSVLALLFVAISIIVLLIVQRLFGSGARDAF